MKHDDVIPNVRTISFFPEPLLSHLSFSNTLEVTVMQCLSKDVLRQEIVMEYEKFLEKFRKMKYSCLNCKKYYSCEKWKRLEKVIRLKPPKQLRLGQTIEKRKKSLDIWRVLRIEAYGKVIRCIDIRRKLQRQGYKMFEEKNYKNTNPKRNKKEERTIRHLDNYFTEPN